jgi:hypothetical protein
MSELLSEQKIILGTLGPEHSHARQAAARYAPAAEIKLYPHSGGKIVSFLLCLSISLSF